MVAMLLLKLIETPVGSPIALAVKVSVQVVLKVYTTFVIAEVAVTVCVCGPDVKDPVISHGVTVVEVTTAAGETTVMDPLNELEAVPELFTALIR